MTLQYDEILEARRSLDAQDLHAEHVVLDGIIWPVDLLSRYKQYYRDYGQAWAKVRGGLVVEVTHERKLF